MECYHIGIVGSAERVKNLQDFLWWCFPLDTKKGTKIFLYCPRSVNEKMQGVFALCELNDDLDPYHKKNYLCSGFGTTFGRGKGLNYGGLKILKQYKFPLTAKEMKNDPLWYNRE